MTIVEKGTADKVLRDFRAAFRAEMALDDCALEADGAEAVGGEPTPASAIGRWKSGFDRSRACGLAVVSILGGEPSAISELHETDLADLEPLLSGCHGLGEVAPTDLSEANIHLGFAVLTEHRGKIRLAESILRGVWDYRKQSLGLGHADTILTALRIADMLDGRGEVEDAQHIRLAVEIEETTRDGLAKSLRAVRRKALDYFLDDKFDLAETIYHKLEEEGFELGSTYIHLARVYFMTDQDEAARHAISKASQYFDVSEHYVRVRGLFFRALERMLLRSNAEPVLRQVWQEVYRPGPHLEWHVSKVIDHLQCRLLEDDYILMHALGEALSHSTEMPQLEALERWSQLGTADSTLL